MRANRAFYGAAAGAGAMASDAGNAGEPPAAVLMPQTPATVAVTGPHPAPPTGALVRSLWLLWVVFVVYGSLVPLEFRALPWDQAVARFAQTPWLQIGVRGRADWVANGVLYVPVGFLTATLLAGPGRGRRLFASLCALLFGLALALAVEFSQLYFPPRTVSRNDLLAEGLGSAVGVVLAWFGSGWLPTLQTVLKGHWRLVAASLVPGGAVVVMALSLFPFDLLVSTGELATKVASPLWGWWAAPAFTQEAATRQLARLAAEMLVLVPLGALWARSALAGRPPPARASLQRAFVLGAGLGLLVETGQWFVASGVSQGLSVLTRALGWTLGAWLWNRRSVWGVPEWRAALRRLALPLVLLHALAAVVLNDWFGSPWRTPAEAAARALGGELRFVPFYYHYYISEAVAVYSLLAVALLYAPVGLWCWARHWAPRHAAWAAAAAAVVVEVGKLFPLATRPDPTNVLVAAAAAAASAFLLQRFTAPHEAASPGPAAAPAQASTALLPAAVFGPAHLLLVVVAVLASFWLVGFPVHELWVGLLLIVCAGLVWWRPVLLFGVAAAALPALNLSAWSGREYVDEFDVLLLVCLAVAVARRVPAAPARDGWLTAALWLLAGSVLASALIAWRPWDLAALRDPDSPLSPWSALRLSKGMLWALCLYAVARWQHAAGLPVARSFGAGMVLGLVVVVGVVVWERAAFVGLWDFATAYRVAGPVLPMRLGGAYLDAGLVAGLPFALAGALHARAPWLRLGCAAVALGAVYAVAVTFTRTTYLAAAVGCLLVALAALRPWPRQRQGPLLAAAMLAALAAAAYPIVTGPFASARLAAVQHDLGTRTDHWLRVLGLSGDSGKAGWIGHGLGRFPVATYWAGAATQPDGSAMAVHRFLRDGGVGQLQLGPGPQLYLDQAITLGPDQGVQVQLRARAIGPAGQLSVMLCHKWLLSSDDCTVRAFAVPAVDKGWHSLSATLQTGVLGGDAGWLRRPVRLSLHNAGAVRVDVAQVSLRDARGRELLRNGNFDAGSDHWTYTSDDHLAWHVKNMPLAVWFDQGLAGVVAFSWLLGLALVRGGRAAWSGDRAAQALSAALVGLLIVSAFDSVVDEPRFLLLTLTLAWLAAMARPGGPAAGSPATAKYRPTPAILR